MSIWNLEIWSGKQKVQNRSDSLAIDNKPALFPAMVCVCSGAAAS